jgi:hypothetical protein
MLDPLTAAEIQTIRLKLLAFADQQSDQTVRSQCSYVANSSSSPFASFKSRVSNPQ